MDEREKIIDELWAHLKEVKATPESTIRLALRGAYAAGQVQALKWTEERIEKLTV